MFIVQKWQMPFLPPMAVGHSSWKKAWGLELLGWQTHMTHLPIKVLSVLLMSIRDIFSGQQSLSLSDEDHWVDEDNDVPMFVGNLSQLPAITPPPTTPEHTIADSPLPIMLHIPPHVSTACMGTGKRAGTGALCANCTVHMTTYNSLLLGIT